MSYDLIHWKQLPIAIYPEQGNYIFSGSAIIDYGNVTGLQPPENESPTLIAIFTAHDATNREEKQWLAYSNDGPLYEKFTFYAQNPIVPNPDPVSMKDFRDPQVFQYDDYFVMLVAATNRTLIYNSPNLIDWTHVSEFGENEGSHRDVWECPSLFPLKAIVDGEEVEKWVLIISLGLDQQYFIGSFDGKTFSNDHSAGMELWVDYGPDSYAGTTFNQMPSNSSRVFMSWMNRWEYASFFQLNPWNGQMSVPRELKLIAIDDDELRLTGMPVENFEKLRVETVEVSGPHQLQSNESYLIYVNEQENSQLLDITMSVDIAQFQPNDTLRILFGIGDGISIVFNGNEFIFNRTAATAKNITSSTFVGAWRAPRLVNTKQLDMRIIIDKSSIEFFADKGLSILSGLSHFDYDHSSHISVKYETENKDTTISINKQIFRLKSIWNESKSQKK